MKEQKTRFKFSGHPVAWLRLGIRKRKGTTTTKENRKESKNELLGKEAAAASSGAI